MDLNFAFDVFPWATLDFTFGYWNIADRPGNVPNGDSHLLMTPTIASLQLYRDIPRWKSRYYVAGGVGYSDNSYDLGDHHRDYVMAEDNLTTYHVTVSDGPLVRAAFGWEFYSSADAKLNLAIEASYLKGQATLEIERNGSTYEVPDEDSTLDDMSIWMLRSTVTWHF
jgi:hypothetical protein